MTKEQEKHDYDTPWKEVIEIYFREFIEFFFPEAYKDIDWTRGHEFLDKELRQITKDADIGRKYVDKLVKVWLKSGEDAWALIHSDIQIEGEKDFDERMYIYNYRLYDRYRVHAASFAVIGYAGKDTGKFEKKLWGCEVSFKFPVVRLKDYGNKTDMLEQSGNPFAVVVLAYLKTKATAKDSGKRVQEKIALIRFLYSRGFSKQDIINLMRFIDWIMFLPKKEDDLFRERARELAKEGEMPYITSFERWGYDRGIQDGIQHEKSLLARQIAKKFKSVPDQVLPKLEKLEPDDLLELGEQLFDFESLEAAHKWIEQRTA